MTAKNWGDLPESDRHAEVRDRRPARPILLVCSLFVVKRSTGQRGGSRFRSGKQADPEFLTHFRIDPR